VADLFEPLAGLPGIVAAFVPRLPGIDVDTDRATALERLAPAHGEYLRAQGFDPARLATAEQIHGDTVAVAERPVVHAGADALVTSVPGLTLGIYVADCAAVYLADRHGRAAGLVHSGRAGTTKNIVGRTISVLHDRYGIEAADLIAEISPCIRPPLYESDFAAEIVAQAHEAGVGEIRDCSVCTGQRTDLYYSYRVEKGRTGRMLAVIALQT